MRGKVAVVTGGASGIGRALALRFAAEGARGVVVADVDVDGAAAVARDMERGLAVGGDVALEAEVASLIDAAERAFGPVDLFCANAGVAGRRRAGDVRRDLGRGVRGQPPLARGGGAPARAGMAAAR